MNSTGISNSHYQASSFLAPQLVAYATEIARRNECYADRSDHKLRLAGDYSGFPD